tara:strand:+ start:4582 stop:5166 length:585 start_codon:yes stop_codon:yes gene_type:complete
MAKRRYTEDRVTLREHLDIIDQNGTVSENAKLSLIRRLKQKFKDMGYTRLSKNQFLIRDYIDMIFETQEDRCTHWIETKDDQLNGVWNRPGSGFSLWRRADVVYELDHVFPVNAGGKDGFENFQFLSANANQFVKCSLTYDDLLKRVDLSRKLKTRIRRVLARRKKLFKSDQWKNWIQKVEAMEAQVKKVKETT